jgi:hypothetical protein
LPAESGAYAKEEKRGVLRQLRSASAMRDERERREYLSYENRWVLASINGYAYQGIDIQASPGAAV